MGGAAAEEVTVEVAPGGKEEEIDFSKITIDEAFKVLQASHHGLTSDDVTKRIAEYGYNKLPESSRSMLLVFLGYMWNPLSWAMEAAAIIAIALLDYADFALIVGLLLLNAIISFVEESSADKAIKALTAALAPKAKALRDGQVQSIDAINLVPGDIIVMRLGDIVPADVKILGEEGGGEGEETPMQIDQAALTGESLPAKKFTGDVAFSGSTVKQGERHCVVYATGVNTFFGRAAALISSTNNVANLQRIMNKVSAICLITIGVWVVIELAVQFGHYDHACYSGQGGCPTLVNMLVIIVGGIPIAMPTVLSVTLALGAYALAKEGAIVARMSAVEEMAGMDVLCSDKTGTLTLNKLSVETTSIVPLGSFAINDVLLYACLSANIVTEEPIDVVLYNCYPEVASLKDTHKMVKFVPFNPTDKFTAATIQELKTGRTFRLLKGSPQVVVRRCHNFADISQVVNDAVVSYANRGFRSLGLALAEGDGPVDSAGTKWEMVGVIPMFDPPRHDTKAVVEECFAKGIRVKMITGDHLLIGIETAKMLGMGHEMFTAEKLLKAKTGDKAALGKYKDATEMVETANGFAEVFPEHKFEIVQILQDADHIVGMTGDGVNDAPALKKADVGIAVAGATDAARGAADIVLTEAGLGAISTAVVGARKIFQRMTTYSKYTVAMTFRICFTFGLLTVIYDWYFPTILIVLLAVFNDGAMIALSKDKVVASPVPNSWNLRNIFIMGIVYGLYLTLSSWAMYQTAVKTSFFHDKFNLPDLDDRYATLQAWCGNYLEAKFPNIDPNELVINADTTTYPEFIPYVTAINDYTRRHVGDQVTFLAQCMAEQFYLRGAMMRTFLYVQVSISGQALVFVVRTQGHSLMERAGLATYIAFFAAQTGASLFGVFGFGGYEKPDAAIPDCQFCSYSNYEDAKFFRGYVPIAFTEPAFTASVVGCVGYVAVAWVWCMIWYVLLDPIKWALCWILNDDGFRDKKSAQEERAAHNALERKSKEIADTQEVTVPGGGEAGYNNPLGRTSLTKPVGAALDKRQAAVMPVVRTSDGLVRVSTDPQRMHQLARRSLIGETGPSPHQRTSLTKTSMQKKSHEIGPVAEGVELREVRTDL